MLSCLPKLLLSAMALMSLSECLKIDKLMSSAVPIIDDSPSNGGFDDPMSLNGKCEPLNADVMLLCKDIAYNETLFPNHFKHKTQQEAAADSIMYLPLVRINCSPVIKLFLCSVFAPPCVKNYSSVLKPCREMCEKARAGCENFMKAISYNWPDHMDCANFPSFNSAEACVTDEYYTNQPHQYRQPAAAVQPFFAPPQSNSFFFNPMSNQQPAYKLNSLKFDPMALFVARTKFTCPAQLQIIDSKKNYYLSVNDDTVSDCGVPCDNTLFESSEVQFARSWVLIWATLCFCSTCFTILTFLVEVSRFRYPERPIIFLSGCYMLVALAYIIGSSSSLTSGNALVCQLQKTQLLETKEFVAQGTDYYPCTVLFMITYFFGMASSIWWVILTLTWFLAAGLKWGHEAIESISSYFHLAAWAIPAVKMVAILALRKVDADLLSGICYTGLANMNILRGFILAPLVFYLIMGTCFLLAGFVSLFRIRRVMHTEGTKTDKLEKFMVRIGVFSILYMVPAIILICCYFYEQNSYAKWIDYWLKKNIYQFNLPPDYFTYINDADRSSLIYSIFMIKYAMILCVGITSGFWIWSQKTINSWKHFLSSLFRCFSTIKPSYKHEAAV